MKLPQRPDPSIISEAIPLFYIFQNGVGFWVTREEKGHIGGIFVFRRSALRFAKCNSEPPGCATMLFSERFELDTENHGNPFVPELAVAKRVLGPITRRVVAFAEKAVASIQRLRTRYSRVVAEQRLHRAAIERQLFGNRYRLRSKSDDDLLIGR
jgi:hypothetical protein